MKARIERERKKEKERESTDRTYIIRNISTHVEE
jgi:hypothetical protein